jgi:hypothetical protein
MTLATVWTGRALQAENDDLEKCWSCASVSGLFTEPIELLAVMDSRPAANPRCLVPAFSGAD